MAGYDKVALHQELVAAVAAERDQLVAAHRTSREGVVHEDARAEGDKDMRATEASYVARGQALRVEALEADLQRVSAMKVRPFGEGEAIAMSALVTLEGEGGTLVVFLAPAGGGMRLGAGKRVQVVTHASPLGRALLGAHAGDTVEVERAGATQELEVVEVV